MLHNLRLLDSFHKVLEDYQVSKESMATLEKTRLILLVSPSSSGRNTIVRELVKSGDYKFIISDTTRPPRINDGISEVNGVHYWFRKEKDVLADLEAGKFLEAEVIHDQQVSGISMRELEIAANNDKIAITDVDIGGVLSVKKVKPAAVALLVLPPSFEEWQRRLNRRGKMHKVELRRRMKTAVNIFQTVLEENDLDLKVIINDNLVKAVNEVDEIARMGLIKAQNNTSTHISLVKDFSTKTKRLLEKL